jgi:hypothetical protein
MTVISERSIPLILFLVVFTLAAVAIFPWVAPGLYWGDFPELATTATVLGIPHGPGYPTYTLLASLFVQVLPTNPVHAANLASWFFGALACTLAALVFFSILKRTNMALVWRSIIAFCWGLAQIANLDVFSQSLLSEVYTLNLAFLWFTFLAVLIFVEGRDVRWAMFWAFITGIAAGNHLLGSLAAPGLLIVVLWQMEKKLAGLARMALFFGLGISTYLLLPIRSVAGAALDWGHTQTIENFLWTVTNRGFMEGKFEFPLSQVTMALGLLGDLFWDRLGWFTAILAVIGLGFGWVLREYRILWLALVLSFLLMSVFVINNIAPAFEWSILSIPTYAVCWFLALLGLLTIWRKWLCNWRWGTAFATMLAIGAALMPAIQALPNLNLFNKADNNQTDRIIALNVNSLPPSSVLITMSSTDYFAMQNRQIAYHLRPDVDLAFGMLLRFDWARRQFHEQVRDFNEPAHLGVNVIYDYCSTPQSSRPLFFQPTDGVMDRYLAVDLVPWGMLYLTGDHLALKLADYLPLHERMLAEADAIMSEKADLFTPAQAAVAAEARAAYYLYLRDASHKALSLLSASSSSARQMEEALSREDPPTALEIARKVRSTTRLQEWLIVLDEQSNREMRRVAYFRKLSMGESLP